MEPNPKDRRREWLCACLCFLASGCFFIGSALGRDPYYLSLVAGILQWIAGFVWLIRLRPTGAAQRADAAGEPQAARG
jgi:hypothetical protein